MWKIFSFLSIRFAKKKEQTTKPLINASPLFTFTPFLMFLLQQPKQNLFGALILIFFFPSDFF